MGSNLHDLGSRRRGAALGIPLPRARLPRPRTTGCIQWCLRRDVGLAVVSGAETRSSPALGSLCIKWAFAPCLPPPLSALSPLSLSHRPLRTYPLAYSLAVDASLRGRASTIIHALGTARRQGALEVVLTGVGESFRPI
jgi:hypothetical protein